MHSHTESSFVVRQTFTQNTCPCFPTLRQSVRYSVEIGTAVNQPLQRLVNKMEDTIFEQVQQLPSSPQPLVQLWCPLILTWNCYEPKFRGTKQKQRESNTGPQIACQLRTLAHTDAHCTHYHSLVEASWNVIAYVQKPDFVFRRNGRVHLNRWGCQFSRLLAAEVCVSAVVMLDAPCSEVLWRVLATHTICQFSLPFPSRVSPCAITFQLNSTQLQLYTSLIYV
jgi:hypothetical protein